MPTISSSAGNGRASAGCAPATKNAAAARGAVLQRLGVCGGSIRGRCPCRDLSIAQQQAVEIAKALATDARILVMDEPSATLTPPEIDKLFAIIRDLKSHGIGIIYISHRLDEIEAIADRVMVLRDGQLVGTKPGPREARCTCRDEC